MNTTMTTFDAADITLAPRPARRRSPEQRQLAMWAVAYDAAMDAGNTVLAHRLEISLRALTPDWWLHVRHPTQDDERAPELAHSPPRHAPGPDADDTLELEPTEELEFEGVGYEQAFHVDAEFKGLLAAYDAAVAAKDTQSAHALAERLEQIDAGWFLCVEPSHADPVPTGVNPHSGWDGWG